MRADRYVYTDAFGNEYLAAASGTEVEVVDSDGAKAEYRFFGGRWHGPLGVIDAAAFASLLTRASILGRGRRIIRDAGSR